ncbi:cystathionine beta-lyase, partial [Streptococcus agalactiae]|nr:cystathionine beta-lyase [Streptococcus agalactiae]
FNQEELLELVKTKSGKYYYSSQGRESVIYIDTKSTN